MMLLFNYMKYTYLQNFKYKEKKYNYMNEIHTSPEPWASGYKEMAEWGYGGAL